MVEIRVNGQTGTVNVQKGQNYTVEFIGFSQTKYLFDINTTPDTKMWEGDSETATLRAPNRDTTLVLRAYDYCLPGDVCFYPASDVTVNVGAGDKCSPGDVGCYLTPDPLTKILIAGAVVGIILGAAYLISRSPTSPAGMVRGAKEAYRELRS